VAIRPYYTEVNPHTGRALFALNKDDFEKVRDGYGCANCLEDYFGVYLLTCPVCKHERDLWNDFVALPDYMVPEPDPIYSE
jgi:hypothetical protein